MTSGYAHMLMCVTSRRGFVSEEQRSSYSADQEQQTGSCGWAC